MDVFHAYDIRGIAESEITIELAYKAVISYCRLFNPKLAVVGFDARNTSELLANAVVDAFRDSGVNVHFIGLVSTPVVYFAVNHLHCDVGIIVTASHNPKEYNGLKFCKKHAVPVYKGNGLELIEKDIQLLTDFPKKHGEVKETFILLDYITYLLQFAPQSVKQRIVVDCSNGAASSHMRSLLENIDGDFIILNDSPDPNFPAHSPNPLEPSSRNYLAKEVKKNNADFGVQFDGDADRISFVDENGDIVDPAVISSLCVLARLANNGATKHVVQDLKIGRSAVLKIQQTGAEAIFCRVGSPFIKEKMRQFSACFGAESSGHYMYKDFFYSESPEMVLFDVLSQTGMKKLSDINEEFLEYYKSDEINIRVTDTKQILATIEKAYMTFPIDKMDGISVDCQDFWFNVRASNTEPFIRLNIEAISQEILDTQIRELQALIVGIDSSITQTEHLH